MAKTADQRKLSELAGLYYVAYKIALEGYIPVPLPEGQTKVDMLALNPRNGKIAKIQVKSSDSSKDPGKRWAAGWGLGQGLVELPPDVTYVLVQPRRDACYVIQGDELQQIANDEMEKYLESGGPKVNKNPDVHPNWVYNDSLGKYKDAWQILRSKLEWTTVGDGSLQCWTDALESSKVVPVNGTLSGAAQDFYQKQVEQNQLDGFKPVVPKLTPDLIVSDGVKEYPSLVMSWDYPPDSNILSLASWDYKPGKPLNLSGTMINVRLFPPEGVWNVSIELIDVNNRSRGWFGIEPRPAWGDLWLEPDRDPVAEAVAPQPPFIFYSNEPDFDITQVKTIRFDEAGISSSRFPVPDPTQNGVAWNAWNYVSVIPIRSPRASKRRTAKTQRNE